MASLRSANPALTSVGVACLLLSLSAKTERWRELLPREAGLTFWQLFRILHISIFLNNVLPLRAGDLARGAMTARLPELRVGHVISSMVAERALDAVALLAAFVLAAPLLAGSGFQNQTRAALAVLAVLAVVGLVLVITVRLTQRRGTQSLRGPLLSAYVASWVRLASVAGWRIWVWSIAAWLLAFTINLTLFHALDIEVSPLMAIVVTCTTNFSMLIPASPGHIGVYHAAATLTLVAAGVSGTDAASFSLLSHLVNVLPTSIIGAGYLAWSALQGRSPRLRS